MHARIEVRHVFPEVGHLRSSISHPKLVLEGKQKRYIPDEQSQGLSTQRKPWQHEKKNTTILGEGAFSRSCRKRFGQIVLYTSIVART